MQVTLLSTSDVHGYVRADDFRRPAINDGFGLSRAATVIETIKHSATADNAVITIENGDFIQGSPLTNYISRQGDGADALYGELADQVGYDVRVLGNHEFNYGRDYLTHLFADDEKLINANVIDDKTQAPFIGVPYKLIERDGVKVGIIGLTTSYVPHWETAENIQGLTFLDPIQVAQQYIAELREQVDVLVLAYHGGFAEDLDTGHSLEAVTGENQGYQLLQLSGVDALITGHQHRKIAQVVNGVPTTQPGYRGSEVGEIVLTLDENKHVQDADAALIQTQTYPERDDIVIRVDSLQNATNTWLDHAFGHVGNNMQINDHFAARRDNHPFIELVNRVQMEAGQTNIANTALFNDEVQGLPDAVTLRDIMTNYIYPNTLVVEKLSGADIKAALEVNARYFMLDEQGEVGVNPRFLEPKVQHYNYDIWSGIDYTFEIGKPFGQRVTDVQYQGQPLDMDSEYEVAMNNYRASGAGDFPMFATDKIVREVQQETADLIGDYIIRHPEIQIDQPHNVTVKK